MEYNFLENNLLIICPSTYKREILKYLEEKRLMFNIKFMSKEEYIKNYLFDYDEKTINYLVHKGMKVDNAITLVKNLYYIQNREYGNEKLDYLVHIKEELESNHLLIFNESFHKMLDRYKTVIYGYGRLDTWTLSLFKEPKVIDYPKNNNRFIIYHFKMIEDEVEGVFQKIVDLLAKGIDINKISLMNLDEEYSSCIKRMSILYDIPVDIPCNDNLLGTIMGKYFYDLVLENKELSDISHDLEKFREDKNYSSIINIINKYIEFNLYDVKEQIKYELLNTKIKCTLYENTVRVKNIFDYVSQDEYIFLLNFNSSSIPRLSLDIDYITDNIKDLVGLPKTVDINILSKENTFNYLASINNLVITYKEITPFNTYQPSILLDDMNYELKEYNRQFNYSHMANQMLYTIYLDDLIKFGIMHKDLGLLYHNYQENNYLAYDNCFNGINKEGLLSFLHNELTLSYSSIDNYYKCGFKYYLSNILKIDLYEETFMTLIGNLFHEVLRKMNESDFNLESSYQNFLLDRKLTAKEKFFLDKLKKDLQDVIEIIRKHQFITGFSQMLYEKKIDIKLKDSPYIHFKGFVDKIMYKEKDNKTFISIIDYKTGNPDINIKNLQFGLSMQLPIYLYLVKNSDLFHNMHFVGFYLQHILMVDVKDSKKSLLEKKYDSMKLVGYSIDDKNILACFDSTYENSEMIKGMKVNKDNAFSHHAKVLSEEEIDNLIKLTEEKIILAMNSILNGEFYINPKILDSSNVSCKYCQFNDICYHEEKNNVYLETKGGEDDAELDERAE